MKTKQQSTGRATMGRWAGWLLGGLLAVASGCEQGNPAVLLVRGNVVPQVTQTNGVVLCTYGTGDNFYLDGVMDMAITSRFRYYAWVENRMTRTSAVSGNGPAALRAEGNTVTLTNVHVTLNRQANDGKATSSPFNQPGKVAKFPLAVEWDIPTYAVVDPENEAPVPFDLVPAQTSPNAPVGDDWRVRWGKFTNKASHIEQVILTFRMEGTTAEGVTVTAGEVSYPVSVCWGCLLMMKPKPEITDAEEQWKQCSKFEVDPTFLSPCQAGVNEGLPCGYYCQQCTKANNCDPKFCPPLN